MNEESKWEKLLNNGNKEFTIEAYNLHDYDISSIVNALASNKNLEILTLMSNNISSQGLSAIAETLKINTTLKKLKIVNKVYCGLDKKLRQELGNRIIISYNWEKAINDAGDSYSRRQDELKNGDVIEIAEILKINKTLKELYLGENYIKDKGAIALADALKINQTLKYLCLEENDITDIGANAIIEMLKVNNTIEYINFRKNDSITDKTYKKLSEILIRRTKKKLHNKCKFVTKSIIEKLNKNLKIKTDSYEKEKYVFTLEEFNKILK